MRIVIALGGNALLRRGEPPRATTQRANVARAAAALAPLASAHELVLTHGNGPQVGLLAAQQAAARGEIYPLDVLDAETAGQIGYLLQQELGNRLGGRNRCAALITQVEVAADDPAFAHADKPIGAVYDAATAAALAQAHGWTFMPDGDGLRRAVPSPAPRAIVELDAIATLLAAGTVVICAGGGGVPVVRAADGALRGIEAVVDKDRAATLLAQAIGADALLLLTDVDAVYRDWPAPRMRAIARAAPRDVAGLAFAAGSMAPKIEAAVHFVEEGGRFAAIGNLEQAAALLAGEAGTTLSADAEYVEW